ncbi:MAG: VWA domain-containing protein [Rhodospirillales bacterium]|nr:VWA domain-containing protein [Rhodospirillales bacterium]
MNEDDKKVPARKTTATSVDDFLQKVATTPVTKPSGRQGRLLFALDATASREPTWDRAAHIQAEMFQAAAELGGLEMQVAYFRGFGEFQATRWVSDSKPLLRAMTGVLCMAGETQIGKVLKHAINENAKGKVDAVVFVGDAMEEDVDRLGRLAGELGLLGVPVFVFQEGADDIAEFAFGQIAKLSGGAYCRLDSEAAQALRDLLRAVAVYAAGGRRALADHAKNKGGAVAMIAHQMK